MRPKMHAVLLDATINSALTLRLNLYQVSTQWLCGDVARVELQRRRGVVVMRGEDCEEKVEEGGG
jgi:hypothetical protein